MFPDPRVYIWWDRRHMMNGVIETADEDAFVGAGTSGGEARPWRELLPSWRHNGPAIKATRNKRNLGILVISNIASVVH